MRFEYRTKFVFVFLGLFIGLSALTYAIHLLAILNWNKNQAEKYVENSIYRAELLVDNTILKIREIPEVATSTCDTRTLNSIRRTVYNYGIIQDVRIRRSGSECWAFGNSDLQLNRLVNKAKRFPAQNPDYSLFVLNADEFGSLGMEWQETNGATITVVVSIGHILFDILPPEIRDDNEIQICLSDGTLISRYSPIEGIPGRSVESEAFEAASTRYPLSAQLRLNEATLWNWNRSYSPPVVIPVLVVIAGLSFLIARGIVRDNGFAGEIETAIARREIIPFYQPIFCLQTGDITGFEMLARWFKPNGQFIPPGKFIPFAEETGHIDDILDLLLTKAGEEIGPMLLDRPNLKLTFNVTPQQYLSEGFVDHLTETLNAAGIPLKSSVVEVTERQSLNDNQKSETVSQALIQRGIRIAIDDAGTGHNGLSSIHSLDAQFLKIDKYFVDALFLDKKSSTIIEMLMSIAGEFGMTVVAEGIEKEEQAESLSRIGVQEGQGYYFSRPIPAAELKELVAQQEIKKST